jgi:hypothetical protein
LAVLTALGGAGLLLLGHYPVALAVFTGLGVLVAAVPFWDKVIE